MIETRLERPVERDRVLIRPVTLRRRDGGIRITLLATPAVMAGHPAEQLVPGIEARRHVPDRLRQRQILERARQIRGQPHARARAEQAVVVVDEAYEPVVDPLVIRHVRVRRMDAHRLVDDLGPRPPGAHEVVEHRAGPDLVARENALFELRIEPACLVHHLTPILSGTAASLHARTAPSTGESCPGRGRRSSSSTAPGRCPCRAWRRCGAPRCPGIRTRRSRARDRSS